ncbi:MAG: prevent-host-death protein [Rhizobiales bacterium 65-9]|nr:MAG: prevent-host-death protein [Rhizobiales bacterium 65-9]
MGRAAWTVAEAKARFSEVLDKAAVEGPQTITRNGKPAAVIVGSGEWDSRTRRKGTLLEFFQSAPEGFADLDLERAKSAPRELDL